MKIAVLHRYPPSQVIGTNASFVSFLEQMVLKKHKVYYVTYNEPRKNKRIKGVKFLTLPFTFNRGNNFDKTIKTYLWIFLVPFYVTYYQRKYKFDLVYCDDSVPYYGFLSKLFSPSSKVVIRLGDLQSAYSLADKYPLLFRVALNLEKFIWHRMDGIITISKSFANYLKNNSVTHNVRVVEESVNFDQKIAKRKRRRQSFTFMFHGALVKCKGVATLLNAFAIFNKKYPKSMLIIAGGGPEENYLKKIVDSKSIKNVEFTGWYGHERLEEIISRTDVGIAMRSSNLANNFVVTTCLLENWKYKKPTIAPNLEAIANIATNKEDIILFQPDNQNDLFNKMEMLYKNLSLRKKIARNGFLTAKKYFKHNMIAKKMIRTLESYL